ncbi:MAG: tetratricopeptide repeat protein [Kofleriaceae bacterium]|nr:tetratricopeptide repeat protein [Kofleriaceae bacterium]
MHVAAAEVALADGDAARALVELEPAGDLAGRPEALALRGRARLAQGQVDPATADLDAALALAPDLEPALVARAEVDLRAGNARAAVGLLERHYREDGAGPLAITYAAALRGVGELDRARTVLATLTRDDVASPLAGEAWLETARLERDAGNPRAARAAYAKAIERSPRTTEARLEAAELAIDTGDAAGARESLDKLRADAPTDGRVLVETARVHVLTGDLDGAKALLEQAEAAPDAPRWLIQRERGRLALRQRVLPVAIEALERAASLEPGDGETRLLLIDAHLGADDGASARRVLEDVMKRFAGRPEMQLAVGRVRLYFDALGEAREAFVKAKDQLEREKAAPRWIAEATYWLARTTYYDGDADKARPLAVQALQLDPNLVDAHALLGTIDSERGQFKAAAASWEKVTRLDPAADEAWFELGAAAAQSRQKKLARKALETFLQRVPTSDLAPEAKKLLAKL